MKQSVVVYHSTFNQTKQVAEAIAQGLATKTKVVIHPINVSQIDQTKGQWNDEKIFADLDGADVIVFGSPTYMGNVSGIFKLFLDACGSRWPTMAWKDKIAGGFTTSSHPSGDKLSTLLYLVTFAMQMRMIWVGTAEQDELVGGKKGIDRFGYSIGIGAQGTIDPNNKLHEGDLETAELYGVRLATIVHNFSKSD
ncbi:MAG: flavodoxin family protein [Patescibacteria group bacterium]|nr:flavodoxin family protein [Patescibacteria group bacterium]